MAWGSKIQAVTAPDMVRAHRFGYCDIDFNRHVNSCRYIEALLNDRSVEFYDNHMIKRFEIAYMDEIHYDDAVELLRESSERDGELQALYEITRDGTSVTRARIKYKKI